jgi:hypothetical protein
VTTIRPELLLENENDGSEAILLVSFSFSICSSLPYRFQLHPAGRDDRGRRNESDNEEGIGVIRSVRVTRAARFGRSLSLQP